MSKITFTTKQGEEYVLEYNRRTCEVTEARLGVSMNEIMAGKITQLPALFKGAFLWHHPNIKPSKVDELFESMGDKERLFQSLIGMYAECVNTLLEDPDEGNAQSWELSD